MELCFLLLTEENYPEFHALMNDYYRAAKDQNTPQSTVDGFIRLLFEMVCTQSIHGRLVQLGAEPIGFVLWGKDIEGGAFSEVPGRGTILEIGLAEKFQKCGFGRELVRFAENQLNTMDISGLYVLAYGPAQGFWERCGYRNSGKIAASGLPVFLKERGGRA